MALYTLPKQYHPDFAQPNKKPVGGVELDKSNKFSEYVDMVLLPRGGNITNIVNGDIQVISGSVTTSPQGVNFSGSASDFVTLSTDADGIDKSYSVVVLCTFEAGGGTFPSMMGRGDTGADEWMFRRVGTSIAYNAGSGTLNAAGGSIPDGARSINSFSLENSALIDPNVYVYQNGDFVKSDTSGISDRGSSKNLTLGGANEAANRAFSGTIEYVVIFNTALSASQQAEFSRDLYQILKPKTPPVYFTAAAAGGNTLTADSGTYTYTGTAATLTRTLIMAADSGTYTYSGTAADLLKGYVIVADSGAYTYTGTAAALTFAASGTFTLTADTGAYTYTGTNADLLRGLVVGADSGAYTYTGTNAVLSHGFVMPADSGAYSYTGATITFKRDRVIIAATGAYTYTGTSVALISSGGGIWTDKTGVTTTWNDQANSTTIWTDK